MMGFIVLCESLLLVVEGMADEAIICLPLEQIRLNQIIH